MGISNTYTTHTVKLRYMDSMELLVSVHDYVKMHASVIFRFTMICYRLTESHIKKACLKDNNLKCTSVEHLISNNTKLPCTCNPELFYSQYRI